MEEEMDIFDVMQPSTNDKDNCMVTYYNAADSANEKNMILDSTTPKFSRKTKFFRTGAANILKRSFGFANIDEGIVKLSVSPPVIESKRNVAKRGKPFRRQGHGARSVDFNLPHNGPETLTELVSEGNFCHRLLENKDEGIVKLTASSPVIAEKENFARRGKPFRRQGRRAQIVDFKLPNDSPETLTELVSERNFCNGLLENKDISNDVKLFIDNRLKYVNFKIYCLD